MKKSSPKKFVSWDQWKHQSKQSKQSRSQTTAQSSQAPRSQHSLIEEARAKWPSIFHPSPMLPPQEVAEEILYMSPPLRPTKDQMDASSLPTNNGSLASVTGPAELSACSGAPATAPSKDGMTETKQGMKFDDGKIPTDLFSVPAYIGVCKVLQFGAKKYAAWNWSKGLLYMRVYAATLRHLFLWVAGEDNDQETGLSHIDHAMCELMFLSHFMKNPDKYKAFDDRPYGKVA